jgi:acyl-CoA synthetase (AMP-forming)/AMP-acid ligase II
LIPALTRGSAMILREGFVPHSLLADARAYGAAAFPGVPFMFEHLTASPPSEGWPPSLQKLVSAGARLEPSTVRRFFDAFGVKIHSFYGTSETGGIAYDDSEAVREETTVGPPISGASVTLREEAGAPADGGRVHVAGKAVASGYVGENAADGSFADGGFLTGDFGRFDSTGHLVLTGRVSAFINVAGRKVQPEEVEQVLRAMPSIADVRVLGAPDAARGQQIVACLVPRDGQKNLLAVRQYCAARLAVYKVPRQVIWLDAIPLTPRGKTDRARLEALVREELDPRGHL